MLSLGTDLGMGQPMEHVIRQSLIALRLAERLGLDEADARGRLLRRPAGLGRLPRRRLRAGEVVRRRHRAQGGLPAASTLAGRAARGVRAQPPRRRAAGWLERARLGVAFLGDGRRDVAGRCSRTTGSATNELAARLGLGDGGAREPLPDLRALGRQGRAGRGQGRGDPARRRGWSTSPTWSRSSTAAAGVEAAVAVARERSGTQFDPALVDALLRRGARRCSTSSTSATSWDAVIDAEPALAIVLSDDELDAALEAIADFADLKSPWTIGHSRGGRRPGGRGGDASTGSPTATSTLVRRAGAGARPRPARRLQRDLGQAGAAHRRRAASGCACTRT